MQTLNQKLILALKGSSSHNPKSTEELAAGHKINAVKAALIEMKESNQICHCKITRSKKATDYWWITGHIPATPSGLLRRKIKDARAAEEDDAD